MPHGLLMIGARGDDKPKPAHQTHGGQGRRQSSMFNVSQTQSMLGAAFRMGDLILHNAARSVRSSNRNAVMAIVVNIVQTLFMVGVFYFLFDILGMRSLAIRGDFLLYIMSGIFVFMTHVKSMTAVAGAEGPISTMMNHAPMNTYIAMCSAAVGALYTQVVSMGSILLVYHLVITPISFYDPFGAVCMLLLAWFSGCAVGTVFLATAPWLPTPTGMAKMLYQRFNMFASGKMFVANNLNASLVVMFAWNPLFHIIDQGRGYIFVNYIPHKTNLTYPIVVSLILLVIGLLGESFTRRHISLSWTAGR